jgi:hypothetical protein
LLRILIFAIRVSEALRASVHRTFNTDPWLVQDVRIPPARERSGIDGFQPPRAGGEKRGRFESIHHRRR